MGTNIFISTHSGASGPRGHRTEREVETSRRVGWAKYFDEADKVDEMRSLAEQLYDLLRFHGRIPSGDSSLLEASRLMERIRGL